MENVNSQESTTLDRRSRPIVPQAIVATLVYLAAFCCGLTGGFSGFLLPQLRANTSDLQTDDEMASWFVSVYTGATSVGCLVSGVVMDLAGRRVTVQTAMFSLTSGWVLISLANSHTVMLIGRALDGFGRGLSVPSFTFHLEEMADPGLRGALSACILLAYSVGIMAVSMMGNSLTWRIVAGIGAAFSVSDLIGYSFLKESPVWLARNNRIDQATEVFDWLWGNRHHHEAKKDLQELMKRLTAEQEEQEREQSTTWKQYLRPHLLKAFLVTHVFNLFQILCGTNLFIFYAADIVAGVAAHNALDVSGLVIATSVVRVVFLVVSCGLLVWFGRRPICVTSGLGSGMAALGIGAACYLQVPQGWAMYALVLAYVAFNTYGFFVLPPSMVGELLPSKIRCFAGAYIFTMNDVGLFGATKVFPALVGAVGTHGLFWLFGVSSLACSLFLYLLLPETKGRSLVEIEEYFLKSNILWVTRDRHCERNERAV